MTQELKGSPSVRIDPDIHPALKLHAVKNQVSIQAWVNRVVFEALKKEGATQLTDIAP